MSECQLCDASMTPDVRALMLTHADCLSTFIAGLSESFRNMPEWSQRLIADRTPFLASDETFTVLSVSESQVSFRSRGFIYCADSNRMQVV